MEFFLIWIFSIIIGVLIGNSKGRGGSGFVWSFLFGPLGVIVVLCLKNLTKEKEKEEQAALLRQQIAMQKAQLDAMQRLQAPSIQPHVPTPRAVPRTMRVAKNGQDLGDMDIPKIKLMLRSGELTLQDYYFDRDSNDWMPLESNPFL